MAEGSSSSKRYKGQIQVVPGSPTGEPLVINRFSYNALCLPEYVGEAKYCTEESDHGWFLQKLVYDGHGNVSAILIAQNKVNVGASSVTVDVTSDAPLVRVEMVGADLEQAVKGDELFLKTPGNSLQGRAIKSKISETAVLVDGPAIAETAAPLDLYIRLKDPHTKEFERRRWDKRHQYRYS